MRWWVVTRCPSSNDVCIHFEVILLDSSTDHHFPCLWDNHLWQKNTEYFEYTLEGSGPMSRHLIAPWSLCISLSFILCRSEERSSLHIKQMTLVSNLCLKCVWKHPVCHCCGGFFSIPFLITYLNGSLITGLILILFYVILASLEPDTETRPGPQLTELCLPLPPDCWD